MPVAANDHAWPGKWWFGGLVIAAIVWFWLAQATGIVSSNDGSHLALARSVALRGEVQLAQDWPLTLQVDWAQRDNVAYSDRPPGTAILAGAAVIVGHQLDKPLLAWSRARNTLLVTPASRPFLWTYAKRFPQARPLAGLMGSALIIVLHAATVGLSGLALWWLAARRLGLPAQPCAVAAVILALATLWGPYATCLFAHGSALLCVSAWTYIALRECEGRRWTIGTGLTLGAAALVDPTLGGILIPWSCMAVPARRWPWLVVGALPGLLLWALYNQAAFGAPWALGYDFQANFAFAQGRESTFDGDLWRGLNAQWSPLKETSLLAQSPVLAGAILAVFNQRQPRARRYFLAGIVGALPWLVGMATHHTPTGGQSQDARYIVAFLPVLGLGLALTWDWLTTKTRRVATAAQVAMVVIAVWSVQRTWQHFLAQHDGKWFEQAPLASALVAALAVIAGALGWGLGRWQRKFDRRFFSRLAGNS